MFLYINNFLYNANLNCSICICIIEDTIPNNILNYLSQQIYNITNKNILIFYIKKNSKDIDDVYYNFYKDKYNIYDKKYIDKLNENIYDTIFSILNNILNNNNELIPIKSYEVKYNHYKDILDNNFIIKFYNLSITNNVINNIKKLFI